MYNSYNQNVLLQLQPNSLTSFKIAVLNLYSSATPWLHVKSFGTANNKIVFLSHQRNIIYRGALPFTAFPLDSVLSL